VLWLFFLASFGNVSLGVRLVQTCVPIMVIRKDVGRHIALLRVRLVLAIPTVATRDFHGADIVLAISLAAIVTRAVVATFLNLIVQSGTLQPQTTMLNISVAMTK
jgi:hypothetical protein